MRVVLDSNVIIGDFRLRSGPARTFFSELSRLEYDLYVPQIVVDECINKYREKLVEHADAIRRHLREARKQTGASLPHPLENEQIATLVAQYTEYLQRRLSEASATIQSYPTVSHEVIVHRALSRQRPFSRDDSGYRDALIWECALQVADKTKDQVVFVTNDGDFTNRQSKLHQDLVRTLDERSIVSSRVSVVPNLIQFVEAHITPHLEFLDIRDQLLAGTYPDLNLEQVIENDLIHVDLPDRGWGSDREQILPQEIGLPNEAEGVILESVIQIEAIEVTDVRKGSGGEILIEAEVEAECAFEFFLHKSYAWGLSETDQFGIWDYDWNRYYAAAEAEQQVSMQLYIVFNSDDAAVKSIDLLSVFSSEL